MRCESEEFPGSKSLASKVFLIGRHVGNTYWRHISKGTSPIAKQYIHVQKIRRITMKILFYFYGWLFCKENKTAKSSRRKPHCPGKHICTWLFFPSPAPQWRLTHPWQQDAPAACIMAAVAACAASALPQREPGAFCLLTQICKHAH